MQETLSQQHQRPHHHQMHLTLSCRTNNNSTKHTLYNSQTRTTATSLVLTQIRSPLLAKTPTTIQPNSQDSPRIRSARRSGGVMLVANHFGDDTRTSLSAKCVDSSNAKAEAKVEAKGKAGTYALNNSQTPKSHRCSLEEASPAVNAPRAKERGERRTRLDQTVQS